MLEEFKEFINKGNIVDLAVAVVMATAFKPIVDTVVNGVLLQVVAAIFGQPNFDTLSFDVGDTAILYGTVITATIQFFFVAVAVFFLLKTYNATKRSEETAEPVDEPTGPSEIDLLTEIRDSLTNR